jgi:adenylate cyclase
LVCNYLRILYHVTAAQTVTSGHLRGELGPVAARPAGYSKLAAADEERTLARLRALRSDLIDPTIALHHGRVVKRRETASSLSLEVSLMQFAVPSRSRTI